MSLNFYTASTRELCNHLIEQLDIAEDISDRGQAIEAADQMGCAAAFLNQHAHRLRWCIDNFPGRFGLI